MKQLIGKDIGNYVFDSTNGTITFLDVTLSINQILIITNITDNIMIYCFNDSTLGGTLSGNQLTLTYDTSSMSNTDILQIYVDMPQTAAVESTEGNNTTDLLTLILKELELQNRLICLMNSGEHFTIDDMEDIKEEIWH